VQLTGGSSDAVIREAAMKYRQQPAPHPRLSSEEVRAALRQRMIQFVHDYPKVLALDTSMPRPIPGGLLHSPLPQKEQAWVAYQLREQERVLFDSSSGCFYCHVRKSEAAPNNPILSDRLPETESTNLRPTWLTKSQFKHDSHRMLKCSECHPAETSAETSDVLIPRLATCQQCHNPQVGVRSGCVECHRYHPSDDQGKASDKVSIPGWKGEWSIEDFTGKPVPSDR
jgi:hypothetical protein